MENTLENKRLFMLAYPDKEYYYKNEFGTYKSAVAGYHFNDHVRTNETCILLLKPLSSISDEDAIEIAKIVSIRWSKHFRENEITYSIFKREGQTTTVTRHTKGHKNVWIRIEKDSVYIKDEERKSGNSMFPGETYENTNPYECLDFLRSKGYALPYRGLSVEEQISRGWVRLSS